jgi:N-acetylneuraminic acid mutarotase
MKKKRSAESAFFNRCASIALLVCAAAACSIVAGIPTTSRLPFFRSQAQANRSQRTLTFAQRVSYQRAIEEVYWRHRIWPKDQSEPKPSLDAVMSQAQLEKRVADYLRNSEALEDWQQAISAQQLQAEMDRMAQHTRQPGVLRELFVALRNDPFVIAECLARPILSQRLTPGTGEWRKASLDSRRAGAENQIPKLTAAASSDYTLPAISGAPNGCVDDTWTATSTNSAPIARAGHTAIWTGSEMIVWGGWDITGYLNTGGRYDPSTYSWTATSTIGAPSARGYHTAVWTGSEMIVWGGEGIGPLLNTGGRYNPGTDSWTATTVTNAPAGRRYHTAVWTGSEMIVWGGSDGFNCLNTGGRYDPGTDSWTATAGVRIGRQDHTAVWTGSEMIVWGGKGMSVPRPAMLVENGPCPLLNTGSRYNPGIDSWTDTTVTRAPAARQYHTAVWTGNEMIVWGGVGSAVFNTGGRYHPSTDSWITTATTSAPIARYYQTAVWTGREMIVWGGSAVTSALDTGGRYNPFANSWTATSTTGAPARRFFHTAVWTGSEMIVWGGWNGDHLNTGGRYCAQFTLPTPAPTGTPRTAPTPRPRPTSVPRM